MIIMKSIEIDGKKVLVDTDADSTIVTSWTGSILNGEVIETGKPTQKIIPLQDA